jgi:ferredoxin-NADP reductase
MSESTFDVLIQSARSESKGVMSFELRAPDGGDLPAFTAGSHIDVHLPNGITRCYSLVNSQAERDRYVIAVSLDPNSKGGSRYMFESQLVGQTIKAGGPRNNFRLVEDAPHTVLIAGGIGITPMHAMIMRLEELGKSWELHYGTRERAAAAFRAELEALEAARPGRVHFNFDVEDGHMLDVAKVVAGARPEAHLYCCGPAPMLEIYKAAAAGRNPDTVHLEYFAAPVVEAGENTAFTLVLQDSGQTFEIGSDQSILDVLLDAGIAAPFSCGAGECGSCVVEVLEGEPEHRDCVLSDNERAGNKLMMICVSRAKSKKLVINL